MALTIPAQGPVQTPSGFQAVSAQSQIILTWNPASAASTYYISRSTDNSSWVPLAQTAITTYVDTTGTQGTVYYYLLQAGATVAAVAYSSYPAPSVSGIPLNPGQTTCGNLILEAQQRCNKENSQLYTQQELVSMASQSYKELYGIILQKYGSDYYIAPPVSYILTGLLDPVYQAQVVPLPADFFKLMRVEVALNPTDPNSWITLRQFNAAQANLYNYPNIYTMYGITNLRYRLWGSQLQIVPIGSGGTTIRIWYSPRPNELIYTTDTVDMIAGWEEYVVADMCVKMMVKEESFDTAQAFELQKSALMQRIESEAANRNVGEPQTVTDNKIKNFAWTDGDTGDGGGFGGGGYGNF